MAGRSHTGNARFSFDSKWDGSFRTVTGRLRLQIVAHCQITATGNRGVRVFDAGVGERGCLWRYPSKLWLGFFDGDYQCGARPGELGFDSIVVQAGRLELGSADKGAPLAWTTGALHLARAT